MRIFTAKESETEAEHLEGPTRGVFGYKKEIPKFWEKKWYGKQTVGWGEGGSRPSAHGKKDLNLIAHSHRSQRRKVVARTEHSRTNSWEESNHPARPGRAPLPGPEEMNPSPDGSALPLAPAERGGSGRLRRDACPSARPGEVAPPALALAGGRGSLELEAVSSVTTEGGGPAAGEPAGTGGEAGAEWDKDPGRGLAHGIAAPGDRGGRRIIRRPMNGGPAGGTGRRFRMCRG